MKTFCLFILTLCLLVVTGCAAHTNLEPVGRGNIDGHISLGGPVVSAFGAKIPIPYATLGVDYGLKDRLDLNGNLHLLPIAYSMLGFDIGATWYPVLNRGRIPTVGLQPGLLVLTSFKSGVSDRLRVYPCMSGSVSWKAGKGTAYGGLNLTVPLSPPDYDDEAPSTIVSPFVGYRWEFGRNYQVLTELKWHAANVRSTQLAIEYQPVNDHGALTTLFSLVKSF